MGKINAALKADTDLHLRLLMYRATPSRVRSSKTLSAEPRPKVLEKRLRRKSTEKNTEENQMRVNMCKINKFS